VKKFLLIFILIMSFFVIDLYSENKDIKNPAKFDNYKLLNNKDIVLRQGIKERRYSKSKMEKAVEIDFSKQEEKNMVYFPIKLLSDNEGAIYIIDFLRSRYIFHKLVSISKAYNRFDHIVFSPPRGQGPGDISRIIDIKIHKDKLYVSDEGTQSIKVFDLSGNYLKTKVVFTNGKKYFGKFSFINGKLIIEDYYHFKEGEKFVLCDLEGKLIKAFGSHIDIKNKDNSIYHNNYLSQGFGENEYYYLPIYLGFVSKYKKDKVIFTKETIDGLQNVIAIKKRLKIGWTLRKVLKKKKTVKNYFIFRNYILIESYSYENKQSFWDIYTLNNFDYLLTISEKPDSTAFSIYKNHLISAYKSRLVIYDITNLINELQKYAEKL